MEEFKRNTLEYIMTMIMTYVDTTAEGAVPYKEFKRQVMIFEIRPLMNRSLILECARAAKILATDSSIKGRLRDLTAVPSDRIDVVNRYFNAKVINGQQP